MKFWNLFKIKIVHSELLDKPKICCFSLILIILKTRSFFDSNQTQIDNLFVIFDTKQILIPKIAQIKLILFTLYCMSQVIYLLRDLIHHWGCRLRIHLERIIWAFVSTKKQILELEGVVDNIKYSWNCELDIEY